MDWINQALDALADRLPCGYAPAGPPAAEPTALAVLALAHTDHRPQLKRALQWLTAAQLSDGCVPPYAQMKWPGWPTPLAMLAFAAVSDLVPDSAAILDRARTWLLSAEGVRLQRSPDMGHDSTLVGWPWVLGTHSWQEPTAWSVLALKAVGLADHPRTREGVQLLVDRLLPDGGCNYGNTLVLGQYLRPQIEPTGLTLLALAGETIDDPRIERSLMYLTSALSVETTPISLSYGLLGLAAHDRTPTAARGWLAAACQRTSAPLAIALLMLAAQVRQSALLQLTASQGWPSLGFQPG